MRLIYTPVSNKDVYHVDMLFNIFTMKQNANERGWVCQNTSEETKCIPVSSVDYVF